jgi:hypothetical protein
MGALDREWSIQRPCPRFWKSCLSYMAYGRTPHQNWPLMMPVAVPSLNLNQVLVVEKATDLGPILGTRQHGAKQGASRRLHWRRMTDGVHDEGMGSKASGFKTRGLNVVADYVNPVVNPSINSAILSTSSTHREREGMTRESPRGWQETVFSIQS